MIPFSLGTVSAYLRKFYIYSYYIFLTIYVISFILRANAVYFFILNITFITYLITYFITLKILYSHWLYKKLWHRELNKIERNIIKHIYFNEDDEELIEIRLIDYDEKDIKLTQEEIDYVNSITKEGGEEKNVNIDRN